MAPLRPVFFNFSNSSARHIGSEIPGVEVHRSQKAILAHPRFKYVEKLYVVMVMLLAFGIALIVSLLVHRFRNLREAI